MIDAFDKPTSSAAGDAAWEGDSGAAARANHRHAREAADANLSRTAGNISQIDVGDTASAGALTTGAAADHQHALLTPGAPSTSAVGDAAAAGNSTKVATENHVHGREAFATTSDIADIAATESAGTAATVPHGDHVHALSSLGAWTTYSPSFTNITSGAGTFSYLLHGKTLHLRGTFSAGTATAGAAIQISLPAGMTAAWVAGFHARNNNVTIGSNVLSTNVRVFKDLNAGNWTGGDSLANVGFNGTVEIT